ncbi:MAG: hypothetical protein PGN16_07525 [Sphingomonas phyllosphaerae]|uniref:hypothetical protein n=1 Tax=Sphingomonas phyllosphaerae TaxID=257003 RepID=UPI002FFCFBED
MRGVIRLHNRIGRKFLHASAGYDGSCLPKNTLALLKAKEDFESPVHIVEAVVKVNEARKRAMGRKVLAALAVAGYGEADGRSRCSA